MRRPVLGVTMGDAAGVGPEIIARAAGEPAVGASCRPVVIGAAEPMREALALIGSSLALHAVPRIADCRWADGTLEVLDLANVDMATLPRGEPARYERLSPLGKPATATPMVRQDRRQQPEHRQRSEPVHQRS